MKLYCIFLLGLQLVCLGIAWEQFSKDKKNKAVFTWVAGVALYTPPIGRILGWW